MAILTLSPTQSDTQHYSRSQRIDLKAEGMALWTKALLASYESERIKIRKKASVRLGA